MPSVTLQAYLQRKSELPHERQRTPCLKCRKPPITCYCKTITPFASTPRLVILMSPQEVKHPVGTGRMAHQCLSNSTLLEGAQFTDSPKVEALLKDPTIFPMLLFPGPKSHNLSNLDRSARHALCPEGKELVIIVLDATWTHAKQMLHRSPNLQAIPRISFTPPHLSRFIVRKQPHEHCFSSIEAIHQIIELMGPDNRARPHDHLLEVFDKMVSLQLSFRTPDQKSRHSQSFIDRKARRERMRSLRDSDTLTHGAIPNAFKDSSPS
ncbi:MAG: tRNA-uridine aminocarboxypropyltransferase [Bdellovibrionota bacterium]